MAGAWGGCAPHPAAPLTDALPAGSGRAPGGPGDGVPAPQKVLFPAERLSMKWERIYRVGAGLHNLGNTCFLNATVQCLTYTPPLASYLLSREHGRSCEWGAQVAGRRSARLPCSHCCPGLWRGVGGGRLRPLGSLLSIPASGGCSGAQLPFPGCSSVPRLCVGEALSLLGRARLPAGSAGFPGG